MGGVCGLGHEIVSPLDVAWSATESASADEDAARPATMSGRANRVFFISDPLLDTDHPRRSSGMTPLCGKHRKMRGRGLIFTYLRSGRPSSPCVPHAASVICSVVSRLMCILVVGDQNMMADAIGEGLRDSALTVDVVYDGSAALDRCSVNRYDVVVLDRGLRSCTATTCAAGSPVSTQIRES